MSEQKKDTYEKNSKTNETDKIASTVKSVGLGYRTIKFFKTIIFALILIGFSLFLMWAGLPHYIGFALIGIAFFIVIIDVIEIKRLSSANISVNTVTDNNQMNFVADSDEKIIDHISGILRTGFGSGSYSVLGKGKNFTPENALIITNQNIWAVTVPLSGAGQVISGVDISKWQWMAEQNVVEAKLKEMLDSMTLDILLKSCGQCIRLPLNSIEKFKIIEISHAVKFETSDRKKYTYSIRNNDDYIRAKNLLSNMLSDKMGK